MTIDLGGQRAMVVGAEFPAAGAIARAWAGAGADIALCALTADEAVMRSRRVRRDVEAAGRRAAEYVMDVTLGRNVQVTTRQVAKEMGGLDLVVSAPDLLIETPLERLSDTELARLLQVNFSAQYFVVRTAAGEFRREQQASRLLLVSSTLGSASGTPRPQTAAYSAAHAAVQQLVRAAAEELRDDRIAVNAIAIEPGALDGDAAVGEALAREALRLADPAGFITGEVVTL